MKKKECYICHREVIPVLSVNATTYERKRGLFGKKIKTVSKSKKLYFCKKCVSVLGALIVNNVAIKTSDIIDGD